jgi:hypothetical protein
MTERFRIRALSQSEWLTGIKYYDLKTMAGALKRAETVFRKRRPQVVCIDRTTAPKGRPDYIVPVWNMILAFNDHGWHDVSSPIESLTRWHRVT